MNFALQVSLAQYWRKTPTVSAPYEDLRLKAK